MFQMWTIYSKYLEVIFSMRIQFKLFLCFTFRLYHPLSRPPLPFNSLESISAFHHISTTKYILHLCSPPSSVKKGDEKTGEKNVLADRNWTESSLFSLIYLFALEYFSKSIRLKAKLSAEISRKQIAPNFCCAVIFSHPPFCYFNHQNDVNKH